MGQFCVTFFVISDVRYASQSCDFHLGTNGNKIAWCANDNYVQHRFFVGVCVGVITLQRR
jgi:hypothetical protein